ncbi:MAG TPA: hypothetical protein VHZ28_02030 [Terracidiphilus sp.]|jgi:hypothetical protein|nr:hypothetical protein [Terracidiphilus sp.]
METTHTTVETFFRSFESNNNKHDFSASVAQFADTFMAAGPQGAQCVKASDFALALPKRKQLFSSFGCESMKLVSVDPRSLDDRYALAHTRWELNFTDAQPSTPAIFVNSTFVIDTTENRIVLYLAHQDIMEIFKERRSLQLEATQNPI